MCALCWFGIFGTFAFKVKEIDEYDYLMPMQIMNLVSIDTIAIQFSIMALIIFRSSQVAKKQVHILASGEVSYDEYFDSFQTSTIPNENSELTGIVQNSLLLDLHHSDTDTQSDS